MQITIDAEKVGRIVKNAAKAAAADAGIRLLASHLSSKNLGGRRIVLFTARDK